MRIALGDRESGLQRRAESRRTHLAHPTAYAVNGFAAEDNLALHEAAFRADVADIFVE